MKKAHIISHTHWDREWYLPYEKHHMLYIEMMDTLIDTMEKDQADKTLAGEIEDLVEFKYCKASRGSHLVPFLLQECYYG